MINTYTEEQFDNLYKAIIEEESMKSSQGHKNLMKDLAQLILEAQDGEFGDFTNDKYPAPKNALADKLYELRENTINGKYDD